MASNQAYLPNGTSSGPAAGATTGLSNNGRVVQASAVRILCVADVRGNLRSLNELARLAKADFILHTGDFGFYDDSSLERIADKTLKHVAQYSPLLDENIKRQIAQSGPTQPIKSRFSPDQLPLSELPLFLSKHLTLDVPIYTVWGACEDVRVLEKFRSGEYKVDNLHVVDEANSRLLEVGGVKLRLLGLGGAVVMHKLFDNGEGKTTIAGGQGTMWTTLLQMGELIETANRVYDPSETRVFLTHASPAREGILNQTSVTLKADFSISAGLHFRYGSSYNEFSVNPNLDHYRGKLAASKASFNDVWETVRNEVEQAINSNDAQKALLQNALDIVEKMPTSANGGNPFGGPVGGTNAGGQVDESAFKNMWNFNLADAAFGYLVLEIDSGRIGTEMRAQGFNFAHRGGRSGAPHALQQQNAPAPVPSEKPPTASPAPAQNRTGPAFTAPTQPFPQQQQQQQPTPRPTSQPQPGPAQVTKTPAQPQPQPPITATIAQSPVTAPAAQAKPSTPQPTPTNVNLPPSGPAKKSVAATANGTSTSDKTADTLKAAPPTGTTSEKKPPTALFFGQGESEEQIRELFSEEDKSKIKSITKVGKFSSSWMVQFGNADDCQGALERVNAEIKKKGPDSRRFQAKFFEERERPRTFHRESQGGAGTWQGSNRGGANVSARGGFQSGGASDSEGGRGRGGFRGGRGGRGGRGDDRGGIALGGRGNMKGTDGAADPKPNTEKAVANGGER